MVRLNLSYIMKKTQIACFKKHNTERAHSKNAAPILVSVSKQGVTYLPQHGWKKEDLDSGMKGSVVELVVEQTVERNGEEEVMQKVRYQGRQGRRGAGFQFHEVNMYEFKCSGYNTMQEM